MNSPARTRLLLGSAITSIALTCVSTSVNAEHSRWSQELGYYWIDPNEDSSEISGPGLPPGTGVDVDKGGSVLLTTTYHYNENLSFEFFYSGKNELDINADGSIAGMGTIGSLEYLAPTLIANWTFGSTSNLVQPYIGLGINSMIYSGEQSNATLEGALGGDTTIEVDDTVGLALTAGLTFNFTEKMYATLSYVQIGTDTTATITTPAVGTERTVDVDAKLDITYFNLGYRF